MPRWISSLLDRYRRLTPDGRQTFWVAVVLAIALIGGLRVLDKADAPWEGRAAKRLKAGKVFEISDYAQIHLWQAGAAACGALGIILLTCPWWMRWTRPGGATRPQVAPRHAIARSSIFALATILVLAGGLRWPAMNRDILFDEQDNLRRSIFGYHYVRNGGPEQWRPVGWTEAFWENKNANNPVLFSVLAHGSIKIWQSLSGQRERFNLIALRFPSLIAGLGSIAAIWWFFHLTGLRWAADLAALLSAIHPVHIEYSFQARGYGLTLLFTVLAIGFALSSLRSNRWRSWIGFAGAIFGALYSYPGGLYFAVTLNLALYGFLGWRWLREKSHWYRSQVTRLTLVNIFSGILFLVLMAPSIAQIHFALTGSEEQAVLKRWADPIPPGWLCRAWTEYTVGVRMPPREERDLYESGEAPISQFFTERYIPDETILFILVFLVTPISMFFGLRYLNRRDRFLLPILLGGLAAPVIAFWRHHGPDTPFIHYWYIIYLLPLVIILVAAGWISLAGRLSRVHHVLGTLVVIILVALHAAEGLGPGPGRHFRGEGVKKEFTEFQRGKSRYVIYPDGKMVRENPGQIAIP